MPTGMMSADMTVLEALILHQSLKASAETASSSNVASHSGASTQSRVTCSKQLDCGFLHAGHSGSIQQHTLMSATIREQQY